MATPNKITAELLLLCDNAIIDRSGKLSIIGIFTQVFVRQLPTRLFRLYVVSVLSGKPNAEETLSLTITDPAGKQIASQEIRLKFGQSGRANVITALEGMPLASTGNHLLKLTEAKKEVAHKDFQVVNVKPTGSGNLPN
ncbi:MAG: hypothetical protein HYS86_00840 [Candidatus Chisholmbacteria bacterium]|nr:hypothetical protein [Candidatus Chisholmbacteria bacterium]